MLEENYPQQMNRLLDALTTKIVMPDKWSGYLEKSGTLPTQPAERRRFVRWHCRSRAVLEIRQSLTAINRTHTFYSIFMRDVSRCGLSFIHAEQIYPDETCSIWLPTKKVEVKVHRCHRAAESCYVVGVQLIQ